MQKSFQLALALWITPDFSEVLAGRAEPPRVAHSKIDFKELAEALAELFPYGPSVRIRVPNDTIDQVTIHFRSMDGNGQRMKCEDFGQAMLACAKKQSADIIDVRDAWSTLHQLPDREFSPPPVLLPFVVEALDFEDAMIWQSSARASIGLTPFDFLNASLHKPKEIDTQGSLPAAFQAQLLQIFGSPFERPTVLDRMAMDQPPKYAKS